MSRRPTRQYVVLSWTIANFAATLLLPRNPATTITVDCSYALLCGYLAMLSYRTWKTSRQLGRVILRNRLVLAYARSGVDINQLPPEIQEEIKIGMADYHLNQDAP